MQNKRTVIITGAAGFIGSHMTELMLKKNFNVIGIDDLSTGSEENLKKVRGNKNFYFKKKDILDLKNSEFLNKKVFYIFHFAGKGDVVPSIENPFDYVNTNVLATTRICEIGKSLKIKKLVYAASSSCYGVNNKKLSENASISLEHPYALSKFYGEQIALNWCKIYNLPVNSIRIFNAYGPRVRTSSNYGAVFGVFFKQKLENKPFTIVGNGNQKRDYVYVKDVCEAFYLAAQTKIIGEIFNLGTGKPQRINYLAKILDCKNKVYIPKRPGEPNITWANINKISKLLKWQPKTKFEKGVAIMLKDIEYWRKAPLWNKQNIKKATKTWFKLLSKK
mgnify:CR=1 FL=1|tara:strand:+ start:1912 stop:2913 length:1002 start_codon:yes stop_codon:yes gene_type:complete